jgi:Zn-finger nucleic acid-binding protein
LAAPLSRYPVIRSDEVCGPALTAGTVAQPGGANVKCPACSKEMHESLVKDIAVDVCRGGCGGVWFDWMELSKVDEQHESVGKSLLEVERDENIVVDRDRRRHCPRCQDMIMLRHFASVKRNIEVDECPQCGGFFLDCGELNDLRDQFASEAERHEATRAYFADLYDEGLREMAEESYANTKKAQGFARMFRFLLPSYYIPGKQGWGAY